MLCFWYYDNLPHAIIQGVPITNEVMSMCGWAIRLHGSQVASEILLLRKCTMNLLGSSRTLTLLAEDIKADLPCI